MVIQRIRRLALLGLVVSAAVAAAGASAAADPATRAVTPARQKTIELAGKITVVVSLNKSLRGTFSARGSISDSGRASGRRTASGNRVRLTLTLHGKAGRITVLATQACGKLKSIWKVLSGSHAYRGLSGGGTGKGRLTCGRKAPYRSAFTGSVRTPPPGPIAQAGTYSGTRVSQNLRVTLEVAPDGRTVTNLSLRQVVARCEPPRILFLEHRFDGSYPIGADRSFSILTEGYTISGRFSAEAARGTITYEAGGCKAGPLPWKATIPPAPLPSVPAGRYCGFTLQGPGICLDATSDGWVANVAMGAKIRCYAPSKETFTMGYTYEGVIALRSDLTFAVILANIPLEDGGSMKWRISGKFDGEGHVSGTGGPSRVSLVRDGTRYQCRSAITGWSAKLGA